MALDILLFATLLFLLALFSFFANIGRNLIFLLIALEVMLLATSTLFVLASLLLDDIAGLTFSLFLLPIAGCESALALSLLVSLYSFTQHLDIL